MGDFIFPLQFKRQFSGPLDLDLVFATTLQRNNFLTQERRYAGQIASDLEDGKIYQLNAARDKWIDISLQGVSKFLALTGGNIYGNVTIHGDLSSSGTQYFANTVFNTTSALSVVNFGSQAALYVAQDGTGDIASFYDIDSGVEVFHIAGANGSFPNVGVKTSQPNKDFTVIGEVSASKHIWTSGVVYTSGNSSSDWDSVYSSTARTSANWDSVYSSVSPLSANWSSVYSSTARTSANWDSVYSSVRTTSANWDSVYSSVRTTSANWDSVYSSVAPISANWNSVYSSTANTSANWDSVYSSTVNTSANWDSVYSSTARTSANWDSVYSSVRSTSANWDSVYSSTANTSANWDSVYSSTANTSANWDSVYSSTARTSANWDSGYSTLNAISGGQYAPIRRFDIQDDGFTTYSGVALYGTLDTDPAWTITKLSLTLAGTVSAKGLAELAVWNNRQNVFYS